MVVAWVVMVMEAGAQVVSVTTQLDTNVLMVGQSTVMHVYAQVVPASRPLADQIFSWYVDVVNTNGSVAAANYGALLRPVSDKDPMISSNGFNSGANRQGIYDTFLNLPGAGVNSAVELLRIAVTGVAVGQSRLGVRARSGQPTLSQDFIVAPKDGGEFLSGGNTAGPSPT